MTKRPLITRISEINFQFDFVCILYHIILYVSYFIDVINHNSPYPQFMNTKAKMNKKTPIPR